VKIDHQLNAKMRMMGRYSQQNFSSSSPSFFFGAVEGSQTTRNIVAEHTWTISPYLLLTSRFGLDRYYQKSTSSRVDPAQFGLPALLTQANGITRMPVVDVENYVTLNSDQSGSEQCCADTTNGHTQYIFGSAADWIKGRHVIKIGGEARQFFNNFYQPDYATGVFGFTKLITASDPAGGNASEEGTGLASLLVGFPESGQLNIKSSVANKSKETLQIGRESFILEDSIGRRYALAPASDVAAHYSRLDMDRRLFQENRSITATYVNLYTYISSEFFPSSSRVSLLLDHVTLPPHAYMEDVLYFPVPDSGLNGVPLHIPPLRERGEDVDALVRHFLIEGSGRHPRVTGITSEALAALRAYHWPGNVRELKNCVEALRILSAGPDVDLEDLPQNVRASRPKRGHPWDDRPIVKLDQVIDEYILHALERCQGNKSQAARLLAIDPKTLYKRLRKP